MLGSVDGGGEPGAEFVGPAKGAVDAGLDGVVDGPPALETDIAALRRCAEVLFEEGELSFKPSDHDLHLVAVTHGKVNRWMLGGSDSV